VTARPRARRGEVGLTLLEVLAAAMIFTLVMTTLIGTSGALVHRTAKMAQRLEANLLADAVVADLEIQMRQGVAPVIERTEWPSDDEVYVIRVLNRSLGEALAAPATSVAEEEAAAAGAAPALPALGDTRIGGGSGIGTVLAAELPEVAKHLRQYDVEVVWIGVDGPESITRTTFAFDWQAAKVEFAALFPAEDGGEGSEEDGESAPLDEPTPLDPGGGPQQP